MNKTGSYGEIHKIKTSAALKKHRKDKLAKLKQEFNIAHSYFQIIPRMFIPRSIGKWFSKRDRHAKKFVKFLYENDASGNLADKLKNIINWNIEDQEKIGKFLTYAANQYHNYSYREIDINVYKNLIDIREKLNHIIYKEISKNTNKFAVDFHELTDKEKNLLKDYYKSESNDVNFNIEKFIEDYNNNELLKANSDITNNTKKDLKNKIARLVKRHIAIINDINELDYKKTSDIDVCAQNTARLNLLEKIVAKHKELGLSDSDSLLNGINWNLGDATENPITIQRIQNEYFTAEKKLQAKTADKWFNYLRKLASRFGYFLKYDDDDDDELKAFNAIKENEENEENEIKHTLFADNSEFREKYFAARAKSLRKKWAKTISFIAWITAFGEAMICVHFYLTLLKLSSLSVFAAIALHPAVLPIVIIAFFSAFWINRKLAQSSIFNTVWNFKSIFVDDFGHFSLRKTLLAIFFGIGLALSAGLAIGFLEIGALIGTFPLPIAIFIGCSTTFVMFSVLLVGLAAIINNPKAIPAYFARNFATFIATIKWAIGKGDKPQGGFLKNSLKIMSEFIKFSIVVCLPITLMIVVNHALYLNAAIVTIPVIFGTVPFLYPLAAVVLAIAMIPLGIFVARGVINMVDLGSNALNNLFNKKKDLQSDNDEENKSITSMEKVNNNETTNSTNKYHRTKKVTRNMTVIVDIISLVVNCTSYFFGGKDSYDKINDALVKIKPCVSPKIFDFLVKQLAPNAILGLMSNPVGHVVTGVAATSASAAVNAKAAYEQISDERKDNISNKTQSPEM